MSTYYLIIPVPFKEVSSAVNALLPVFLQNVQYTEHISRKWSTFTSVTELHGQRFWLLIIPDDGQVRKSSDPESITMPFPASPDIQLFYMYYSDGQFETWGSVFA
jgi:hypothetical protein